MIELKSIEQMQNAIAKAKAERMLVQMTNAVRQYRVTNRSNNHQYTVNFFIRNGRKFGHCTCKAGVEGKHICKHIAAAAAVNMALAKQGFFNRKAVSVAA